MRNRLNIFLLIGQSNMAGRGRLSEVPVLRHPQVSMFRKSRWITAEEPLHTDKPEIAGIGLGMSFAVELIEGTGFAPIGLVPCAVGGTPLSRWMPGADLYENAVSIAKSALGSGELKGILWHQGEGDSNSHDDAASYGERFQDMIRSLRSELFTEGVPVITGELGPFLRNHEGCDFFDLVNQQLRELERSLPGYACVSADKLHDNGDYLHFDASSLREFGSRYARHFLELTRRNNPSEQSLGSDA
jgi:hypothetical protein